MPSIYVVDVPGKGLGAVWRAARCPRAARCSVVAEYTSPLVKRAQCPPGDYRLQVRGRWIVSVYIERGGHRFVLRSKLKPRTTYPARTSFQSCDLIEKCLLGADSANELTFAKGSMPALPHIPHPHTHPFPDPPPATPRPYRSVRE